MKSKGGRFGDKTTFRKKSHNPKKMKGGLEMHATAGFPSPKTFKVCSKKWYIQGELSGLTKEETK